ncbi:hypothetical protein GLOIN_2v1879067 [Rhizophagus irregularis DAOM 181602=DAOM 197198]|nr:hypothetical protein GLOIN_2v1879067 [Rhizophagus irregularis DAOM 181602=DAOM 197198]
MEEITFANSTNQETNEQLTEQPSKSMMLCIIFIRFCDLSVRIPIYRGDKYGIFGIFDHPYRTYLQIRIRSLYLKWDFGTLQLNSQLPTVCNTAGRLFTSDVFWDPPIVAGDPNLTGYTVTLPDDISAF